MVAGAAGRKERGVTTNGYGVSFWGENMFGAKIEVAVVQRGECEIPLSYSL